VPRLSPRWWSTSVMCESRNSKNPFWNFKIVRRMSLWSDESGWFRMYSAAVAASLEKSAHSSTRALTWGFCASYRASVLALKKSRSHSTTTWKSESWFRKDFIFTMSYSFRHFSFFGSFSMWFSILIPSSNCRM